MGKVRESESGEDVREREIENWEGVSWEGVREREWEFCDERKEEGERVSGDGVREGN